MLYNEQRYLIVLIKISGDPYLFFKYLILFFPPPIIIQRDDNRLDVLLEEYMKAIMNWSAKNVKLPIPVLEVVFNQVMDYFVTLATM